MIGAKCIQQMHKVLRGLYLPLNQRFRMRMNQGQSGRM